MKSILGIACNGTDNSACVIKNGKLSSAVEEERFTRRKHEGTFPYNAISWCMNFSKIKFTDLDTIAISWDFRRYNSEHALSIAKSYENLENEGYPINWNAVQQHIKKLEYNKIVEQVKDLFYKSNNVPIKFYRHHDCHAASSYYNSGFYRSLIFVADDKGEDIGTSLYIGEGNQIKLVEQYKIPHSLGLYYAASTQFLKFKPFNDEGSFMALATYGNLNQELKSWLLKNVLINVNNELKLNPEMISKDVFDYPRKKSFFFTNKTIETLSDFGITVPKKFGKFDSIHLDFAYTIQNTLESILKTFLLEKMKKYKQNCLCISGGLGLNCTLNGKVLEFGKQHKVISKLFVPPWCNDAGGAIGAALLYEIECLNNSILMPKFNRLIRADFGPSYTELDIKKVIKQYGLKSIRSRNISKYAAELLAKGLIIAWFQGRAECGPRALGQRSLLCHPQIEEKERLNKIKQRLGFRPLSPSILEEYASSYMILDGGNAEFMTIAFKATDLAIETVPSAVNMSDHTMRAQIVRPRKRWPYRRLLEEFYKLTNLPILINTSFNICEPIVLTPENAISTFLGSEIDALAIGNFVISR